MDINELIEQTANIIRSHETAMSFDEMREAEKKLGDGYYTEMLKGYFDTAKQILSHPDLYWQVQSKELITIMAGVEYYPIDYIPLKEAIKESNEKEDIK